MKIVSQRGFTVVELMTVVLIAGVLAMAVAPSYRSFVGNQQLDAAARDVQTALMLVRSEAVKRNGDVYLKYNDNWANGFFITTDSSLDFDDCRTSPAAACIRVFPGTSGAKVTLLKADNTLSTQANIEYTKSGRSSSTDVTFRICPSGNAALNQRLVRISATGLPQITHGGSC